MLAVLAWALLGLAGCGYSAVPQGEGAGDGQSPKKVLEIGGYKAGFLHPTDVKSVCVQVFASAEFRREIEYRLTEAIAKRIGLATNYQISKKDDADTILYGELKSVPVTLMGSDFNSQLPKELQTVLIVDWTWKNRRTGEIIRQERAREQASEYIPLAGESSYDGLGIGINRLATRIVEGMEADW